MIEVTLAKNQAPVFPDRCVVCGRPSPGHFATLLANDYSHGRASRDNWVRVPSCPTCALRLHYWRIGRSALIAACLLVSTSAIAFAFTRIPKVNFRLAMDVGALLGLMTGIATTSLFWNRLESAFGLELWNDRLKLRFRIDDVGRAFELANPRHSPGDAPEAVAEAQELAQRLEMGLGAGISTGSLLKQPARLPRELLGPKILREKSSGRLIGHVTEKDFEFLANELQRESTTDADFYIDPATIEMLESDGAPASLVKLLRQAVGAADGIEISWSP